MLRKTCTTRLPLSSLAAVALIRRQPLSSSSYTNRCYKALEESLPHVETSYNRYERTRHGRGESYHPPVLPDVIMKPTCVDDVRAIVRYCYQHEIPLIPFGAGTSLEGHTQALQGGVSLDMTMMQSIQIPRAEDNDVDDNNDGKHGEDQQLCRQGEDPYAVVGPGVFRVQLNEALRHTGLTFMVDPGADASIGGMVSTGASGTASVKYGSMRDNILELECVIADEQATTVRAGTRALKNSAGYDLLSLLCGAEGTLGVITSITVKLHPVPEHVVAAICQFQTLYDAAAAISSIMRRGIPLSRGELLDEISVAAFNAYNHTKAMPMDEKPTLFLEFQGFSDPSLQEIVTETQTICEEEFGGSSFAFAANQQERKALWTARHSLYYATMALRAGATGAIVTDCCVPLSKFAYLIDETSKDVREQGVVGPCFGHAADGNLHCILPTREIEDDDYMAKLHKVNENLVSRTLALGGTCTGEHGVGYGKIKYLERQYGAGAVQMMKAIKQALDPKNIMNPGKVVIV